MTSIERAQYPIAGGQLSVLSAGPQGGEQVVLLHGIPSGAQLWHGVMIDLARRGFRCYAPDLPGYGGTRLPPAADRSILGAADLVLQWLQSSGFDPVWLVGHDFGGMVAQAIAVQQSDQINRLTVSNCPVEATWPVAAIRIFRAVARLGLYAPAASLGLIPNAYARHQIDKGFYDPGMIGASERRRVFWDSKIDDRRGRLEFQSHLRALDNRQSIELAVGLPEVRIPTLIVWASHDRFQPWGTVGVRLRALLPEADADIIDQAGHFVVMERPAEYAETLVRWRDGESRT